MKTLNSVCLVILFCACSIIVTAQKQGKQESWVETVMELRKELKHVSAVQDFRLYRSTVKVISDKAEDVTIDVSGMPYLHLAVEPTEDGKHKDHAAWGNARFIKEDGTEVPVSEIKILDEKQGWGSLKFDKNLEGKPIVIGGKEYAKGMCMHAPGYVLFELGGQYKAFKATIGIEGNGGNNMSSIIFAAYNSEILQCMKELNKVFPFEGNLLHVFADEDAPLLLGDEGEVVIKKVADKISKTAEVTNLVEKVGEKSLKKQLVQLQNMMLIKARLDQLATFNGNNIKQAFDFFKQNYPQHKGNLTSSEQSSVPMLEQMRKKLIAGLKEGNTGNIAESEHFMDLCRKIVLSNPMIQDKEMFLLRQRVGEKRAREVMAQHLGYPENNWTTSDAIRTAHKGWDNELSVMTRIGDLSSLQTIYKPEKPVVINDPDIHWDGERILFASVNDKKAWHLFEVKRDGTGLKQLTPDGYEDVSFFDGCYLPGGKIAMVSTAPYQGVPCIGGVQATGAVFELDPQTKAIRQLNFGQDNDWNPTVLNNGRLMYLRWEYTDATHYFSRILMHMNPDGTGKKEYYGSNSYFPNSMFEARPIPNHPTKFITVVSGHHGVVRSGRLMLFDPQKGRKEADGVIQELPFSKRKVEPIIKDGLVDGVWPQFLAPYPLDDHFFLVTAKPSPDALWGIYLVDVFDNMTLIAEQEGEAMLYPMLLDKRPVPPVIPEKVQMDDTTSTVYIANIYEGQGLKDVEKGTVKALRIFAYHYSYNKTGGHDELGIQSSWDVKRVLGTVPVEEDGSAIFKIPANTPVSLQPLDENGRAMQLMRSWLTGMPGEVVSCVGCHESQNTIPRVRPTIASRKLPDTIEPFYGPVRPFAYKNEIQPLLDRKCTACHNGSNELPDFSDKKEAGYRNLSGSYRALHPYVRRPGPESDLHVLTPMDYHASTSELIQILEKGHYGVKMNKEEWDRLHTWIDLNVPYHNRFSPPEYCENNQKDRRLELAEQFNGYKVDIEAEVKLADYLRRLQDTIPQKPQRNLLNKTKMPKLEGWPLTMEEAVARQKQEGKYTKTIELDNGLKLEMVKIPAGSYIRKNKAGNMMIENIEKAFWMGQFEITNAQFRTFFPGHDSRFIAQFWKDHTSPGYPVNYPELPVTRISWQEAFAFCEKLSQESGLKFSLPTESQWEWACRSGSDQTMWYGKVNDDFSQYANLADMQLGDFAVIGVNPRPMGRKHHLFKEYNFIPQETFDDGQMIVTKPGQYKANTWGLYDMHGNVAEWVMDDYVINPINTNLEINTSGRKTVKGGSWRDRPKRSTVESAIGYYSWQKAEGVGFRVIMIEE